MSMPTSADEDFSNRHGSYAFDVDTEPVKVVGLAARTSENSSGLVKPEPEGESAMDHMMHRADSFRDYLARTCCSFFSRVPTLALLIIALVLIVALIALIPILFVLLSTSREPLMMGKLDMQRMHTRWPHTVDEDLKGASYLAQYLLPPNVSTCDGYGFSCSNEPNVVVGSWQVCDGVRDCGDGSDEDNCRSCLTSFKCALGSGELLKCLRGFQLCDGVKDCDDSSDEERFCRSTCNPGELSCEGTKRCIPEGFRCDGDPHCPQGDDERDCDGKCRQDALWCGATKRCIPAWEICDGVRNCPDGSDEVKCNCEKCCGHDRALCNSSSVCIDRSQICDGIQDCPDGGDESNCPGSCSSRSSPKESEMVTCADGHRYHKKYACSGLLKACDDKCEKCDAEVAFTCADNKCIPRTMVCDGLSDCEDGSDETECDCEALKKKGEVVACSPRAKNLPSKCFLKSQRCDGNIDCPNGDDEMNCDKCGGTGSAMYCNATRSCIPAAKRCDGVDDCPDHSDENKCTCDECASQSVPMYVCEKSQRCFPRMQVCDPKTRCPNATKLDRLYCEALSFQPTSP